MPLQLIHRRIIEHADHWYLEAIEQAHPLRSQTLNQCLDHLLTMQTVSGHQHDTTHTEAAHVVVVVVRRKGRDEERHYLAEWRNGLTVTRLQNGE